MKKYKGYYCDVLVIGSGIAGLTAAIKLCEYGFNVILITKFSNIEESNTYYAQGGIIYTGEEDSPEQLAEDLTRAGDGLNSPEAVAILAEALDGLRSRRARGEVIY